MNRSRSDTYPITVLGGGGGASAMAEALADHANAQDLAIVVCTSDNGSSTGKLAEQFGTLPVGDIRRNLAQVALTPFLKDLLNQRFGPDDTLEDYMDVSQTFIETSVGNVGENIRNLSANLSLKGMFIANSMDGPLAGHTFGNLLLTGMAVDEGIDSAIDKTSRVIGARAKIIPVTKDPHMLIMRDGEEEVRGEHAVDRHEIKNPDNVAIRLEPSVHLSKAASERIENSDLTIIGPGSPFTSTGPVLAVDGIQNAAKKQKVNGGRIVAVVNLLNNRHDTQGWCVAKYVEFVQGFLGNVSLDAVIYNRNYQKLQTLTTANESCEPVKFDPLRTAGLNDTRLIPGDFVGDRVTSDRHDSVERSPYRHNPAGLVKAAHEAGLLVAA